MLKKFLPYLAVLLVITSLVAMERDTKRAKPSDDLTVDIQTQEGDDFKLSLGHANLSSTLKNLIEDAGIDAPLPLPTITTRQWQHIAPLLMIAYDLTQEPDKSEEYLKAIITLLKAFNIQELFAFVQAVNYLDISILLDAALRTIALKNKEIPKEMLRTLPLDLVRRIMNHVLTVPKIEPVEWQTEDEILSMWPITGNKLLLEYTNRIAVWDFATQQEVSAVNTERATNWITSTPDGTKIIVEYQPLAISESEGENEDDPTPPSNNVVVYRADTGHELATLQESHEPNLVNAFVTPDSSKFVQMNQTSLEVWDLTTGLKIQSMRGNFDEFGRKLVIDNTKIYAVTNTNSIAIYDLETSKKFGVHVISENAISLMQWAGPHLIVVQLKDDTLVVWNTLTYTVIDQLPPIVTDKKSEGDSRRSFLTTPDGSKVIVIDQDGVKVWDMKNRTLDTLLDLHISGVPRAALTADGRAIVGQDDYGDVHNATLHMWSLDAGDEIATLHGVPLDEEALLEHLYIGTNNRICGVYDANERRDFDFKIWDITLIEQLKTMNFVQAQMIWQFIQSGKSHWSGIKELLNFPAFKGPNAVLPSDQEIQTIFEALSKEEFPSSASDSIDESH